MRRDSDTEVLLEAFRLLGVEAALEPHDRMFAFALWDRQDADLGVGRATAFASSPPLLLASPGGVLFASRLRHFAHRHAWHRRIDDDCGRA